MSDAPSPPGGSARLIVLLGALVAFGPLAIDLYLPALPTIASGLAASPESVQLSITVFLAGFSIGMLFYGPISDRYGRRKVMLSGIALFTLASLACMLVTDVEQLIAARFLQALGGGAASVLARAVVRDTFAGAEAIGKLSLMAMVTAIAPLVAPLAGSILLESFGWRGTFGALLAWGALSLFAVWSQLPETLPAERRGQLPLNAAFAAYGRLLADPVALGLILAGGASFAGMFAYITAGPFFFIELHGFSPFAYGMIFAVNAIGIFAANYANSIMVARRGPARMAGAGSVLGFAGALVVLAAMATQGGLAGVVVGLFVSVSMTGLLGANCVGLLMGRYQQNAGAAAAVFGASQFGLGMLASAATSMLHDGSGWPMAWVIVCATLASLAGFLVFRRCERAAAGAKTATA